MCMCVLQTRRARRTDVQRLSLRVSTEAVSTSDVAVTDTLTAVMTPMRSSVVRIYLPVLIITIVIIRQFIRRRNMSESLQGPRTTSNANTWVANSYYLSHCYTIAWDRLSNQFLRASAMLKHVIAIGLTSVRPSVRPSVCLSVTR